MIESGWNRPLGIVAVVAVLLISTVLVQCSHPNQPNEDQVPITPADSPTIPKRGFYLGLLPVPAHGQSFEEAYALASEHCEFCPVWGRPTPFYGLANDLKGSWGKTFVEGLIRGNGMFPIVELSFIGQGLTLVAPRGMEGATLSDSEWRDMYKQSVLEVVEASRPLYLSVGNEVNRWYEKHGAESADPNGFQHWVSLYEETYDAVKRLSPTTWVFCTFAREIVSENREADLGVLSLFDREKMDLLALTSYPYAVQGINRPSDLPDDYYSRASTYLPGKPLGLIELGWPSVDAFGGEQGQADLLTHVSQRLSKKGGADLKLLGWAWLHDLDENDHIGLIRRDGTEKLAYGVWKKISGAGN